MKRARVPLLSLAVVCLFFHRAAFSSLIFIQRDIQTVYYPLHQFWVERVKAGHFPGWYPYDGMGQPFVAMLVGGALHPSNVLYLLFSLGTALKWNELLSYAAALWGMVVLLRAYRLSREAAWLGGVAYAFCGYLVSMSNNLAYLMAAATLPWVFFTAQRFFDRPTAPGFVVASLVLTSVLLTGDPQAFVVVCLGTIIASRIPLPPAGEGRGEGGFFWGKLRGPALLVFTAGALGAAQALPTLFVAKSAMAADNPLEVALRWSAHPFRLLEMVVGPLFLNARGDDLLSTQVA
jgi:hypothetical protein